MIPSRIIGKSSGENWIGLIDATYGIILTLLVIELPSIILEAIEKNKSHTHSPIVLAFATGIVIIGYFAIFTVIYDIWSYHKTLLFDARKLRLFALATGWILFLSSLIPPFYYLVNHFGLEQVLESGDHKILLLSARTCVFILVGLVYLLLAALARSERKQYGQTDERRKELTFVFGTSLSKALIAFLLIAGLDYSKNYLPPPIGITILAILTYFPINFFGIGSRWNRKGRSQS